MTAKEIGDKWGITDRMVSIYCKEKRIPGAVKKGNLWLVPNNAKKPDDQRSKNGAKNKKGGMNNA